ncbi:MAG: hydrolase [Cyclobacteriaceae bacterium]
MTNPTQPKEAECCPLFHPEKWDEKTFNWDHKNFIKETVPTLFHIPFPPMIGKKVTKLLEMAESSDMVSTDKEDVLLLFTDPNAFKSELYLSVTGNVPNANNISLTGTFMAKVFDGGYNAIPKFMKQMDAYLTKQNKKSKNNYVHYAYCPKCAKKAGHNYMVLFAEVEQ